MASKSGIERVQAVLIEPLARMGMRRAGNVTAEDHAAVLGRLAERLAYLAEDDLLTLREVVGRHGQGRSRDVWPSELSILSWAHALVPPPESRLVASWMASAEGRRAWAEDPVLALALRRHLARSGVPPVTRHADHWPAIRAKAGEWTRTRTRLLERRERSGLGPADEAWLAALAEGLEELRALVHSRVADGTSDGNDPARPDGASAGAA